MSYSNKKVFEIIPEGSYKVIRNCAKCGSKSTFINTNNFRVNANGNHLDVWLIYQCEKCKHTFNLTIYERKKKSDINKEEYQKFLANDIELATQYGNRKELFSKNKSEIDLENITYTISPVGERNLPYGEEIIIRNPYEIKIRTDKVLAEIIQVTRSMLKKLICQGEISNIPQYLNRETVISFHERINLEIFSDENDINEIDSESLVC